MAKRENSLGFGLNMMIREALSSTRPTDENCVTFLLTLAELGGDRHHRIERMMMIHCSDRIRDLACRRPVRLGMGWWRTTQLDAYGLS
jgi:hypothetical protein